MARIHLYLALLTRRELTVLTTKKGGEKVKGRGCPNRGVTKGRTHQVAGFASALHVIWLAAKSSS